MYRSSNIVNANSSTPEMLTGNTNDSMIQTIPCVNPNADSIPNPKEIPYPEPQAFELPFLKQDYAPNKFVIE
ncbi:hypothetical protein BOTNAR_0140g00100 [Botryotinia narcissicola]|uniref:Uncharacterized protein n=1 Tax=Botryotinia narcissicola TaxID=278944 RepID=A0A4Z1IH26_9HELO|nr:hypothetical protein BOTNAR_0140g00100 [Botryotinia narcissicola]